MFNNSHRPSERKWMVDRLGSCKLQQSGGAPRLEHRRAELSADSPRRRGWRAGGGARSGWRPRYRRARELVRSGCPGWSRWARAARPPRREGRTSPPPASARAPPPRGPSCAPRPGNSWSARTSHNATLALAGVSRWSHKPQRSPAAANDFSLLQMQQEGACTLQHTGGRAPGTRWGACWWPSRAGTAGLGWARRRGGRCRARPCRSPAAASWCPHSRPHLGTRSARRTARSAAARPCLHARHRCCSGHLHLSYRWAARTALPYPTCSCEHQTHILLVCDAIWRDCWNIWVWWLMRDEWIIRCRYILIQRIRVHWMVPLPQSWQTSERAQLK